MDKEMKNHYAPVFYLRRWAGKDDCLYEFQRPYRQVVARPVNPAGTGYQRGLYFFNELPDGKKNFLEEMFFQKTDNDAALAIAQLVQGNVNLDVKLRDAWTRFLMTLMLRSPPTVAKLCEMVRIKLPDHLEALRSQWETAKRADETSTSRR